MAECEGCDFSAIEISLHLATIDKQIDFASEHELIYSVAKCTNCQTEVKINNNL